MRPRGWLGLLGATACLVVLGGLGTPAIASAAGPLWWSAPVRVLPAGVPANTPLTGAACPSTSVCVVSGAGDFIAATGLPDRTKWTVARVGDAPPLDCPSQSLCVGFDPITGNVMASREPADGTGAWTVSHIAAPVTPPDLAGLVPDVSCPSTQLCVAFDGNGNVLTSTDPSGGAAAWASAHVDATVVPCGSHEANTCAGTITALTCPSTRLCVAVDSNGFVLTSTDPTGGPGAWTATPIDTDHGLEWDPLANVACPSTDRCTAADFSGTMFSTNNPTGGAGDWTQTQTNVPYGGYSILTCPSVSLCVASATTDIAVSPASTGGSSGWSVSSLDPSNGDYAGLACPSVSLCVDGGDQGRVWITTNPAATARSWHSTHIDANRVIGAIACASPALCLVTDEAGYAVVGTKTPTPSEAAAILASQLRPRHLPSIVSVLRRSGYRYRLRAPIGGRVRISWTVRHHRAPIAQAHQRHLSTHPQYVTIALTPLGRRLLAHGRTVRIIAHVSLALGSSHARNSTSFELRRQRAVHHRRHAKSPGQTATTTARRRFPEPSATAASSLNRALLDRPAASPWHP